MTDKAVSLEIARNHETEARKIREGIIDPEDRSRREAGQQEMSTHIESYRLDLLAKGGGAKHAKHIAGVLTRLLKDAAVGSVADLSPQRIQAALGRLRQKSAPRTCNHALNAVRAFATWLAENNRIKEVPRGLLRIPKFNEAIDRKLIRRAATIEEINRLFAAAEAGEPVFLYGPTRSKHLKTPITGTQRAALYRLALGTGFRADELRSLRPEWFHLDGDDPEIRIPAEFTKNGKDAIQPIANDLAAGLRVFLAGREPGKPALIVPEKTAKMLQKDLATAGIPHKTADGVLDFHALRHSYVTHLVMSGVNPKIVQALARHSTITLTMDRYAHADKSALRDAVNRRSDADDPDALR